MEVSLKNIETFKKQIKNKILTPTSILFLFFSVAFVLTSVFTLKIYKMMPSSAAIADYAFTRTLDGKVIQVEMGLAASGEPYSSNYGGRNLALTDTGSVYIWGTTANPSSYTSNTNTSNVSSTNTLAKVSIPAVDGKVVAVSVGTYTMYALTENGSVYAWGINFAGECGDGQYGFGTGTINNSSQTLAIRTQSTPKKITALSNIVQVLAQPEGAMALDAEGDVWAWGRASAIRCFTSATTDAVQYMTQRTGHYCIPTPQKIITGENISKLLFNHIPGGYTLAVNEDYSKILGWGTLSGAERTGLAVTGTLAASAVPVRCDKLEQANIKEYKNSGYIDINNNVLARVCGGTTWRYEKVAELPDNHIDWTIKEVASATELISVVNTAYQTEDGIWHAKAPGGAQSFMFGYPANTIVGNFCELNFIHAPGHHTTDKFGFKHSSYIFIRGYTAPMAACMIDFDGSLHLIGKFISGNDTYNPKFQTITGSMLFGTAVNNWVEIFAYDKDNADALLPMGAIKSSTGNITLRFKIGGAKITNIRLINTVTQSVLNLVNNPAGEIPEDVSLSNSVLLSGTYRMEIKNLDQETVVRSLIVNQNAGGHIVDCDFGFEVPNDSIYPGSIQFDVFELGTTATVQIGTGTATNYTGETYTATTTSTKYTFVCTSIYGKKTTHTVYLLKNFMGDDAIEPDIAIKTTLDSNIVKTNKYNYKAYTDPQISWEHPNIIGVSLDGIIRFTTFTIEEYGMHDLAVVYFKSSVKKGELDTYSIDLNYIDSDKPVNPEQADKTDLITLYYFVRNKYDSKLYTATSYNTFTTSLSIAKDVLDDEYATVGEVQTAYDGIVFGILGLTLKVTVDDVSPNKTVLQILYDKAAQLSENNYTEDSYPVFESATTAAGEVLEDTAATQSQIDKALEDLIVAVAGLQSKSNKTILQTAYNNFTDAYEDNYTEDSYASLMINLALAKEILEDVAASQTQIDEALADLITAIHSLKPKSSTIVNTSTLQSIYNKFIELNDEQYTAESYEVFTLMLSAAKDVLEDTSATQSQIDKALGDLISAVLNLQLKDFSSAPNFAALQIVYNKFEALKQGNYTMESYEKLVEELSIAELVIEDESATQSQIDNAFADLMKAIAGLEYNTEIDKTVLEVIIADTQNIVRIKGGERQLTSNSYESLIEAIRLAQDVLSSENATADKIESACTSLFTAVSNLKLKTDANSNDSLPIIIGSAGIVFVLIMIGILVYTRKRKAS